MNKQFIDIAKCIVLVASCQVLFACKTFDLARKSSVDNSAELAASQIEAQQEPQKMNVHDKHFIPKQQYDAKGQEIPYVAEPNPYTSNPRTVKPETRIAYDSALQKLKAGKLELARTELQLLVDQNPDLSGVWVQLSTVLEKQNDLPAAEKALLNAVGANEDNVAAYNSLALVQRKLGKFDAAQDSYIKALKRWPDFAEAHYNLGVLYDLYYNNPLAAQKHFEAYHFLTGASNKRVAKWLVELKRRSGVDKSFVYEPPILVASKSATEDESKNSKAL